MIINTLELKAARVRHGLSQRDIAVLLGTVAGNYANKENGRTSMTIEEANQIACVLELSKEDIMRIFFSHLTSLKM